MPDIVSPRKLWDAIDASDRACEVARKIRAESIREFAGPFYNSLDPSQPRPLNLINRGASVLVAHLMGALPRHEVTSKLFAFRGTAKMTTIKLDRLADELDRVAFSRMMILDALMGPASFCRCGIRAGNDMHLLAGKQYDRGQPYHRRIDFDNWVGDPAAKERMAMRWEGERYSISRALAREVFGEGIDRVRSISDGAGTDRTGSESVSGFDRTDDDNFVVDEVELLDIAIYNDDVTYVVTLPGDREGFSGIEDDMGSILRVVEHQGSERGPFHSLCFFPVPNNLLGVSWASLVRDSSMIASSIMNKLTDQALNAKQLGLVGPEVSDEELKAANNAPDRSFIRFKNPGSILPFDLGKISADVMRFLDPVMGWWNIGSGNTDVLGGAEGSDKTATEYSGMAANANTVMEDMRRTHHAFEEGISHDLMWQIHHDPFMNEVLPYRVAGTEGLEVEYSYATREGDFDDFVMRIRPGTMGAQDPNVRVRRLVEFLSLFMPAGAVNPIAAAKVFGEQAGIEQAEEMLIDPMAMMEQEATYGAVPPDGQGTPGQQTEQPGYVNPPQGGGGGTSNNKTTGLGNVRGAMATGVGA